MYRKRLYVQATFMFVTTALGCKLGEMGISALVRLLS